MCGLAPHNGEVFKRNGFPVPGKCADPPIVEHAEPDRAAEQTTFALGTQLVYSCKAGYEVVGFHKTMCVGEGRWVGPKMTCSRKLFFPNFPRQKPLFLPNSREKFSFYPSKISDDLVFSLRHQIGLFLDFLGFSLIHAKTAFHHCTFSLITAPILEA